MQQGRDVAIVALGGIAAALLVLWIPVGLIEMLVASSGLSEALPAAAPPLGAKARMILAGFAALMTVGAMGMAGRQPPGQHKKRDMRVRGDRKMGFAFSRLTALARGRATPVFQPDAPALRRADAHPDAPARAPIFASRDFGGADIFGRAETARLPITTQPAAEVADAPPLHDTDPEPGFARVAPPLTDPVLAAFLAPMASAPAAPLAVEAQTEKSAAAMVDAERPVASAPVTPAPAPAPTHGLSIAQLTERLERGLASRGRATPAQAGQVRVIADMPVAPAVPVRETVAADADEALRAALGALRTMAARTR